MKSSLRIVAAVALVVLPILVVADYSENQIEDRQIKRVSLGRPYSVSRCRGCGPSECQVMGMQRFSEPRCEAFGDLGSPCRMGQEPENKTLHFPQGILRCNDVFMQFCPCGLGLVCEEAECRHAAGFGQREREERNSLDSQDQDGDEMPFWLEPNRSEFPWAVARFH